MSDIKLGSGTTDWRKVAGDIFAGNSTNTTSSSGSTSNSGDLIKRLLGDLGNHQDSTGQKVADVGSIISSFGEGQRSNRLAGGAMRQDYDRMMLGNQLARNQYGLDANQQRNANESDAMSKLQQTSYLAGGGAPPTSSTLHLDGQDRKLDNYGLGAQPVTDAERQGAESLKGQMLSRLAGDMTPQGDWGFEPADPDSYTKPGTAENIGNYGGAITSGLGGVMDMFGGAQSAAGMLGKVPGAIGKAGKGIASFLGGNGGAGSVAGGVSSAMGKVVPILGGIQGTMGLMHNQGTGRNVMNGLTAGASIGSVVPGIGTAIGAGIGALAGVLRGIGSPSEKEVQGRQVAADTRKSLGAQATPEQMAEAKNAGWSKPDDALALIVVRDQLTRSGKNPQLANGLIDQLFKAEKAGPEAVQQALHKIQGAFGNGR